MDRRERAIEAVSRVHDGADIASVASDFAVSSSIVRLWLKGRLPRALPLTKGTPKPCPRCDGRSIDTPAYAHLLGLYLGDGYIKRLAGSGRYVLSIYCDYVYEGIIDEACDSMYRVNPGMSVWVQAGKHCAEVRGSWKHWACVFPQCGPGLKHTRPIVLADWQRDIVVAHPALFVRGLLHSDGCRTVNRVHRMVGGQRKEYAYPRWFFSNESQDILGLCAWGLDLLGVEHRRNRRNSISIAKSDSVARLDELIGEKY